MAAQPVGADEFAARMAALGLSPRQGRVAVGVSGGADSLALALLASQWGDVLALTVDHGLRAESAAEAAQVKGWMAERGIAHAILRWVGDKPVSGRQAAARAARYRLLEDACRSAGIEALLLAHHRGDQAETLLLRLARGSGVYGLAAMAPAAPALTPSPSGLPRRYRPLLAMPKDRLAATCHAFGQPWIEDPTNRDVAQARIRARALLADPPLDGLTEARLAATAERLSRSCAALDHYVDALLDTAASLYRAGYVSLRPALMRRAPEEIGLRALSRILSAVSGRAYPPRLERVEALYRAVLNDGFGGATCAGCRIVVTKEGLIICREAAAAAAPVALEAGRIVVWDERFALTVPDDVNVSGLRLGALGAAGWSQVRAEGDPPRDLPGCVRPTLPALYRDDQVIAAPHSNYLTAPWHADVVFLPHPRWKGAVSS